ncbi:MAG: hypothetical protein HQL74_16310, partial [Magnetococcales bacterium]|nr:hypothetical protein [Magnetococcales bacterium]
MGDTVQKQEDAHRRQIDQILGHLEEIRLRVEKYTKHIAEGRKKADGEYHPQWCFDSVGIGHLPLFDKLHT